jgi:hypothetical protein
MENRRARGMTVEGVSEKCRCRIVGGWNEADKYADETKEVKR